MVGASTVSVIDNSVGSESVFGSGWRVFNTFFKTEFLNYGTLLNLIGANNRIGLLISAATKAIDSFVDNIAGCSRQIAW
jgi:hypothetical protein